MIGRCSECGRVRKGSERRHGLTPRQWVYVKQICIGGTRKEIGARLFVHYKAVAFTVNEINHVWGTHNMREIAMRAKALEQAENATA